jgi:triosephosphate isomerase
MRRPLIAGNWKMNLTLADARRLVERLRAALTEPAVAEVAVCPPAVYLMPMAKALDGSSIRLGAQNLYHEPSGAFTGEISAAMLKDAGCTYCILGHSERRHSIGPARPGGGVYGEDDAFINRKVKAALASGLTPILCVGETLVGRETQQTEPVLRRQIEGGLEGLKPADVRALVVAYEPVWAIGTGRNATPEQAQEAQRFIRGLLERMFGAEIAASLRILYGGSVKASNAAALTACDDVDGALVGGASLAAEEFVGIIMAAAAAHEKRTSR